MNIKNLKELEIDCFLLGQCSQKEKSLDYAGYLIDITGLLLNSLFFLHFHFRH